MRRARLRAAISKVWIDGSPPIFAEGAAKICPLIAMVDFDASDSTISGTPRHRDVERSSGVAEVDRGAGTRGDNAPEIQPAPYDVSRVCLWH